MDMERYAKVDCRERIMIVTINRPEAMNALNPDAHDELQAAFDTFAQSPDLWIAIVTGAGDRAFCAGNDLKYIAATPPAERRPFPRSGFAGLTGRFDLDKPVIAAVNGAAFGGGFEIALACDMIVAVETATFALPEPLVGVAAIAGGVHRLTRMVPMKRAMEIMLTGRTVKALEGYQLGFVNEIVADRTMLLPSAIAWAERILRCSPMAVRATKQMVVQGLDLPVEQALARHYPALELMRQSRDCAEGPRAFSEKRKPQWTGS
jgi:enoyl-CoA hydratase/carnithine racemase